jgi:DNA-binding NarL/FixJ family response regulator
MAASVSRVNNHILIASRDRVVADRFAAILEKNHETRLTNSLAAMHNSVAAERPALLFIDPLLCTKPSPDILVDLLKKLTGVFVIVIDNQSERMVDQQNLFKAGARGFCKDDITPALLTRAVQLVLEGEYWIPRKLITRMISELAREGTSAAARNNIDNTLVNTLTPRELQVARMVHLGGNNKMIARQLDISERTVKAHLSAIFRKLDIENRLNLALFFSEIS